MFVCMHYFIVCMFFVCMYVCMYVYMYACMYACMQVCRYAGMNEYMHLPM